MNRRQEWFISVVLGLSIPIGLVRGQASLGPFKDSPQLPDTPAARRAKEVLDVLNSGDQERVRRYIGESFTQTFRDAMPMEEHLGFFREVHDTNRELSFHAVRQYETARPDNEIVVILRSKQLETWRGLMLEVEPEPPHRIGGMTINPARPPSDLPPPEKFAESEAVEQLRQFVERLAKSDAFSGTVLLAKNGKVLYEGAYGEACKSYGVPNRIDTKFNLGSMNKMFTAVAIAQLVEKGKLSFHDPVGKHLSTDWLPREVADKVTVHHLLTHTSGLGSYFNDRFFKTSRTEFRKVDDYKPLLEGEKLAFEPGTDNRYSNTGFLLLGAIIEKVSGQSYFDYVRENIFKPAGMTNTDSYEMDQPVPNLAIGYSRDDTPGGYGWRATTFEHVIKGGPAGGGFSTVEDLLKFDVAMRSNKLVSERTRELLCTEKRESNSPGYGYGFGVRMSPAGRVVGHGGGFPGISAGLNMYLDSGYTVTGLSNYDQGAQIVVAKAEELLARLK